MTSPDVNPPLFRLRAFETGWLAPLEEAPTAPLRSLLVAEAELWISLGSRSGYFAGGHERHPAVPALPREFRSLFQPTAAWDQLDAMRFGARLVEAQEDLTPERSTFLELLLFADAQTWTARLAPLRELPGALEGQAADRLTASLLRDASWGLLGPISDLDDDTCLPGHWRGAGLDAVARVRPHVASRLAEVDEARQVVFDRAHALGATDLGFSRARRGHPTP